MLELSPVTLPESPLNKGVHWTNLEKVIGEYIEQLKKISNTNQELREKCVIVMEEVCIGVTDTAAVPASLTCRVALSKIFEKKSDVSGYITNFQKFLLAMCDLLPMDKILERDIFASHLEVIASDFFVKVCKTIDLLDAAHAKSKVSILEKILSLNRATSVILSAFTGTIGDPIRKSLVKMQKAINYSRYRMTKFLSKVLDNMKFESDSVSNWCDTIEQNIKIVNVLKDLDPSTVDDKLSKISVDLDAWMTKIHDDLIGFLYLEKLGIESETIRDVLNYICRDKSFHDFIMTHFKIPDYENTVSAITTDITTFIKLFTHVQFEATMNMEKMSSSELAQQQNLSMNLCNNLQKVPIDALESHENLKKEITDFFEGYQTFMIIYCSTQKEPIVPSY